MSYSNNKINSSGTVIAGYDSADDMVKVKSVQKKFRDSFVGSVINAEKWDTSIGSGGSIVVGGGLCTLNSGAIANSETSMITKEVFTIPFRVNIGLTLSQRIANQEFFVEAVSVNPTTGIPDGLHHVALLFDGTSATLAKYSVQNSGAAPLISGATGVPTTVSGSFYEIEPFSDECWFHGGALDSALGRNNSYRRHQQIPDPNAVFKVRLRWKNLTTAPASTTACAIQYLSIQDYAELTAEITAGRGNTSAGQAMAVHVVNAVAEGTARNPSSTNLNSVASTNALLVKSSNGIVYCVSASNMGASATYLKLYNLAVAPTVGSSVPVLTIPLPAGQLTTVNLGGIGWRFSTGIALAITANAVDTDTTAIAAGQVKLLMSWL